jgi:tetratricopeptide (TPR) repeat protein
VGYPVGRAGGAHEEKEWSEKMKYRLMIKAKWLLLVGLLALMPSPSLWAKSDATAVVSAPEDMIAQAREAYNNHMFKEAAELYKKYLSQYPDGPDREEAGFFFGQCLYLIHDFKSAEAALSAEDGRNKKFADQVLYFRGENAAAMKDFSQSLIYYERLISEQPKSPLAAKAKGRLADLHYQVGNQNYDQAAYSLALQHYLQAKDSSGSRGRVNYQIGMTYSKLNQPDNAAKAFSDLAASSDNPEASRLARYRLARLFEDAGKNAEAENNFKQLIDSSPGHYLEPMARSGMARVLTKEGRSGEAAAYLKGGARPDAGGTGNFDKAMVHYLFGEYNDAATELKALLASGSDPELQWKAKLWLARVYTKAGRTAEALRTWQEFFRDNDSPQDFMRLEYARAMMDIDPQGALKMLNLLRETNASTDDALATRSLVMFAARLNDAESAADSYLGQFPDGKFAGEIALRRGKFRLEKGNYAGAEADLTLATQKHPDPQGRYEAALSLITVYRIQGRPDSAASAVTAGLPAARQLLSPEGRLARENAEISYARGEYDKGIESYQRLCGGADKLSCGPDDLFRLFWGYYRTGRFDLAVPYLDKLAVSGPDAAFEAGFWRAMIAMEKGDPNQAFTLAKDLKPRDPLDRGFQVWLVGKAQQKGGAPAEAAKTLSRIDEIAPEAAIYTRSALSDLGPAADGKQSAAALDDEAVSQKAVVGVMRNKAKAGASLNELKGLNQLLQVEATNVDIASEGMLLVARAGLYQKASRGDSLAMLDTVINENPGSKFSAEVQLYRGEDAFLQKDFGIAAVYLRDIKPEDLPEEMRFQLLYLQGMTFKNLNEWEAMRTPLMLVVRDYKSEVDSAEQWNDIGIGLILAREFSSARTALDLALSQTSDRKLQAEIYYWKGMVEQGSGNYDKALTSYLKLANDYNDQGMWSTTALYEAAGIYAEKCDLDKSLELYRKVLFASKGDKARVDKVNEKINDLQKMKLQGGCPGQEKGKETKGGKTKPDTGPTTRSPMDRADTVDKADSTAKPKSVSKPRPGNKDDKTKEMSKDKDGDAPEKESGAFKLPAKPPTEKPAPKPKKP